MDHVRNPDDGTEIAYRTVGDGSPLVLLHATALSQAMWRSFGYVRRLRDSHRMILIDIRGHGASDTPHAPEAYAMDSIVADVVAVLDELGIPSSDVMGYSLGARVALSFTVAYPERVNRLVLGGGSSRAQSGTIDRLFFPDAANVLQQQGMPEFLTRWEAQRGVPLHPATRTAFSANDSIALAAYLHRSDIEPGVDDSALQAITARTLVFVGDRDEIRVDDNKHIAQQIPDADLLILPGLDHMGAIAANDAVLDWLRP